MNALLGEVWLAFRAYVLAQSAASHLYNRSFACMIHACKIFPLLPPDPSSADLP